MPAGSQANRCQRDGERGATVGRWVLAAARNLSGARGPQGKLGGKVSKLYATRALHLRLSARSALRRTTPVGSESHRRDARRPRPIEHVTLDRKHR